VRKPFRGVPVNSSERPPLAEPRSTTKGQSLSSDLLSGHKRFVFYGVMLLAPLVVAAMLVIAYQKYRRHHLASLQAPKAQAESYQQQLVETIRVAQATHGVLTQLAGSAIDEYARNWAEVMKWVPIPGVSGNLNPNVRGKYVNTNDLGYRSLINFRDQIALAKQQKADGKKVVVLVGGSTAFGTYSNDDDTSIVGYLNANSAAHGSELTFYNFANGSYTSEEELNALADYANQLNPDLLIIMDGANDAFRMADPDVYHVGIGVPFTYLTIRAVYPSQFKSDWLDRTYDVNALSSVDVSEFFDFYERNLHLMIAIMKSLGGSTVLATQPVADVRNPCYAPATRPIDINLQKFMPMMAAASNSVAVNEDMQHLDLTGIFDGPNELCRGSFFDTVHLASVGQRKVAERLYNASMQVLRKPEARQ